MAAADAIATGSTVFGGGTPFAWANLLMGGGAGIAKPAGPSSADALFGSTLLDVDSSGWMVNIGSGAQNQTTGDRGGSSLTPVQSSTPVTTAGGGGGAGLIGLGNYVPLLLASVVVLAWLKR